MSDILELRQRITQEKEALVQRLKRWRKLNGLSVRQTVAMMQSLGFPVISRRTVNKAEIRALRKQGLTLLSLAQRFKISESGVSRICSEKQRPSGRRRTKAPPPIRAKATIPAKEPKPAPKIWNFPR